MAGIKIDNFSTSSVNLTAIMDTLQALRQGHFQLSLSEMDTDVSPKILAGSIIDINGSMVYFNADETVTGTPSDGLTYVKLVYASDVVSAQFTNTAPVWDSSRNGWYGSGANIGHRYVAKMIKAGTLYTGKKLYEFETMPYTYETQFFNDIITLSGSATVTNTFSFSGQIEGVVSLSMGGFKMEFHNLEISGADVSITLKNPVLTPITQRYTIALTVAIP